jgi:hypothetical protein
LDLKRCFPETSCSKFGVENFRREVSSHTLRGENLGRSKVRHDRDTARRSHVSRMELRAISPIRGTGMPYRRPNREEFSQQLKPCSLEKLPPAERKRSPRAETAGVAQMLDMDGGQMSASKIPVQKLFSGDVLSGKQRPAADMEQGKIEDFFYSLVVGSQFSNQGQPPSTVLLDLARSVGGKDVQGAGLLPGSGWRRAATGS